MKKKASLITVILFALASFSYAAGYLERLRGIDQTILCFVVWFAPALAVMLFALGGFLYSTGNPTNRGSGKTLMLNSIAGLFLVVAFLGLAVALVPDLKIDTCINGPPQQEKKTCADAGGQCGCPDGKVCEAGSEVTGVADCASDTCCKKCVDETVPEKTCTEQGYSCGCPDGQECADEASGITGCDAAKTCCKKCEDIPCCQNPVSQSACSQCENPSNALCFASNCALPYCKNCHDVAGCHYVGEWSGGASWWWRCMSCCSGDYKADSCEKYVTKPSCEENPCQVSKGGCVKTGCKWSCADGDQKSGCCSPA